MKLTDLDADSLAKVAQAVIPLDTAFSKADRMTFHYLRSTCKAFRQAIDGDDNFYKTLCGSIWCVRSLPKLVDVRFRLRSFQPHRVAIRNAEDLQLEKWGLEVPEGPGRPLTWREVYLACCKLIESGLPTVQERPRLPIHGGDDEGAQKRGRAVLSRSVSSLERFRRMTVKIRRFGWEWGMHIAEDLSVVINSRYVTNEGIPGSPLHRVNIDELQRPLTRPEGCDDHEWASYIRDYKQMRQALHYRQNRDSPRVQPAPPIMVLLEEEEAKLRHLSPGNASATESLPYSMREPKRPALFSDLEQTERSTYQAATCGAAYRNAASVTFEQLLTGIVPPDKWGEYLGHVRMRQFAGYYLPASIRSATNELALLLTKNENGEYATSAADALPRIRELLRQGACCTWLDDGWSNCVQVTGGVRLHKTCLFSYAIMQGSIELLRLFRDLGYMGSENDLLPAFPDSEDYTKMGEEVPGLGAIRSWLELAVHQREDEMFDLLLECCKTPKASKATLPSDNDAAAAAAAAQPLPPQPTVFCGQTPPSLGVMGSAWRLKITALFDAVWGVGGPTARDAWELQCAGACVDAWKTSEQQRRAAEKYYNDNKVEVDNARRRALSHASIIAGAPGVLQDWARVAAEAACKAQATAASVRHFLDTGGEKPETKPEIEWTHVACFERACAMSPPALHVVRKILAIPSFTASYRCAPIGKHGVCGSPMELLVSTSASGAEALVERLIPHCTSEDLNLPIDRAVYTSRTPLLKKLLAAYDGRLGRREDLVVESLARRDAEVLKLLVQHGVEIDADATVAPRPHLGWERTAPIKDFALKMLGAEAEAAVVGCTTAASAGGHYANTENSAAEMELGEITSPYDDDSELEDDGDYDDEHFHSEGEDEEGEW